MGPILPPPSSRTVPSFCLRESRPESPAASFKRGSLQAPALISHRFMPQTSLMSKGAMWPRKIDDRNEETSVMRDVI